MSADNVPGSEIVFKFSNFSLKLWFLAKYSFLDDVSAANIFKLHSSHLKGSLMLIKFCSIVIERRGMIRRELLSMAVS